MQDEEWLVAGEVDEDREKETEECVKAGQGILGGGGNEMRTRMNRKCNAN